MPMPAGFPHRTLFLQGRPYHKRYDAFWHRHPPMDPARRAKIFSPFDALKGLEEALKGFESALDSTLPVCYNEAKKFPGSGEREFPGPELVNGTGKGGCT